MKKTKLFLSAAIVVAVVGSAFAFRPLGQGQIYCSIDAQGVCQNKISWKVDAGGTVTDPCSNGPLKEYFIDAADSKCKEFPSTTTFSQTPL